MSMRSAAVIMLAVWLAGMLAGCGGSSRVVHRPGTDERREVSRAAELTRRATAIAATDAAQAERLLREAVEADPFNGDARNNLGVLFMDSGRLFDAALSFEAARKLLPAHPDPRLNLGLTLERAGRIDDAIAAYEDALEVRSDHVPAMQALAMCRIRHARSDAGTDALLREIAMRGETEAWRSWAADVLLKREGANAGAVRDPSLPGRADRVDDVLRAGSVTRE